MGPSQRVRSNRPGLRAILRTAETNSKSVNAATSERRLRLRRDRAFRSQPPTRRNTQRLGLFRKNNRRRHAKPFELRNRYHERMCLRTAPHDNGSEGTSRASCQERPSLLLSAGGQRSTPDGERTLRADPTEYLARGSPHQDDRPGQIPPAAARPEETHRHDAGSLRIQRGELLQREFQDQRVHSSVPGKSVALG